MISILSVRFGRHPDEFRVAPLWLFLLIVCGMIFGVAGLGVIMPISVLASNIPQLVVAFREIDLADLSLGTWILNCSDGLVWGTYALVQNDVYILIYGSFQMVTSGSIVLLKTVRSHRKRNVKIKIRSPSTPHR